MLSRIRWVWFKVGPLNTNLLLEIVLDLLEYLVHHKSKLIFYQGSSLIWFLNLEAVSNSSLCDCSLDHIDSLSVSRVNLVLRLLACYSLWSRRH